MEIFAGADRLAAHDTVPRGQRSICEDHVAELRRPRLDRLRRAPRPPASSPDPEPPSLVSWPKIEVPMRPIEVYAAALGGAA